MKMKSVATTLLGAFCAPLAFTQAAEAQDIGAAERECVYRVEREHRPRGRVEVISSDWAQSGTKVVLEADGRRWSCMANDDGEVWALDPERGSGSSHGQGSHQGGGVTLYRDTEFRGTSVTIHDDVSYLGDTRIGNDSLSSIRVSPGCRVWIYRDANFEGRSVALDRDERELGRTAIGNDQASSLQVNCRGGDAGYPGGGGYERSGVTLYADSEFRGRSVTLDRDESYLGNTAIGNDSVSSIRVPRGCRARLFADSEFRGRSIELDRDENFLGDTAIGNDSVSSIEVRCR